MITKPAAIVTKTAMRYYVKAQASYFTDAFSSAQLVADYLAARFPGQIVEWRVDQRDEKL